MAKKTVSNVTFGRKLDIDNLKAGDKTKDKLKELESGPNKEAVIEAIDIINTDDIIDMNKKKELILTLKSQYSTLFNFNNCPDDYEELKKEVKFLAEMTQYSFLLMAQRLLKIRDNKLYLIDGYPDFKSFIDGEVNIRRTMAYNYIDILSFFGVQALEHENNLEYSKLIPVIPLLKANDNNIPKEEIKDRFIKKAKNESFRTLTEEARELKVKYGLVKEKEEVKLIDKIKVEIEKLSHDEKRELRDFMKRFE